MEDICYNCKFRKIPCNGNPNTNCKAKEIGDAIKEEPVTIKKILEEYCEINDNIHNAYFFKGIELSLRDNEVCICNDDGDAITGITDPTKLEMFFKSLQ